MEASDFVAQIPIHLAISLDIVIPKGKGWRMDGDDFSRATRLGRTAAEAIRETVANNVPFDGSARRHLIDRFVKHAGGIPGLPAILELLADLASEPLFLQARTDEGLARIAEATHGPECTTLDLHLARSRTVEMYHRYATEIRRFLTVARPALSARTPRPVKEVDRDLFAATR